jgi:hypothetical protein
MAAKTDKKTLELIAAIRKQKEEIGKADRPSWRTNCSFAFVEGASATINLQVNGNVRDLVAIGAFLLEKRRAYEEAAKLLGVESPPPFTWSGFAVEDWLEDLRLRIGKIQIAGKRRKLEELEARLDKVISADLRAELELKAIADELGS